MINKMKNFSPWHCFCFYLGFGARKNEQSGSYFAYDGCHGRIDPDFPMLTEALRQYPK
jgi:hypothetical protein